MSAAIPVLLAVSALSFPPAVPETRPWGICHLLGSAAETVELAKETARWRDAGLGGVRVVPIYGAKGWEDRYVEFMSPEFIDILRDFKHLSAENGMAFDLSFGAGWCFGGKSVPPELGVQALKVVKDGEEMPPRGRVLWQGEGRSLVAYFTGQGVKRTQKADSGPMMNPFSPAAMKAHISQFKALDGKRDAYPRATFHDSFEYVRAAWSDELPALFRKYRGYSLEDHYAELAGVGNLEQIARIKCDYRETLSDILCKETFPLWTSWCRERGMETHNQAHGAPANLLEFYAVADTPETEMFGRGKRDKFRSGFDERFREGLRNPLISKFASSAAHLALKRHTSAESFTWLAEHFCETLEEVKAFGDLLFLSGVNRLYYHATVYSPDSAPWPGWCFYAGSELNPRNPQWRNIKPLNEYFTRIQSLLAEAQPDNDVLLYWPIHDQWMDAGGFAPGFGIEPRWFERTAFGRLARRLWDAGYSFDYVTDAFLTDETISRYKAVVVPETRYMKNATFARLAEVAGEIPVIFEKRLPESTPGLSGGELPATGVFKPVGDVLAALADTPARRDAFAAGSSPFDCVRMKWKGGLLYFIVNASMQTAVLRLPDGALVLDPMSGGTSNAGIVGFAPAQSLFVWVKEGEIRNAAPVDRPCGEEIALGEWTMEFAHDVSGWPLPPGRGKDALGDWTRFGIEEAEFSGTAVYKTVFRLSEAEENAPLTLELGEVCNSARISVNGTPAGIVFMHPYTLEIPAAALKQGENLLEVEVSNLGANRIRAYDRKGITWKVFENANVMGFMTGRLLKAGDWPILPSGLIGPVHLRKRGGE